MAHKLDTQMLAMCIDAECSSLVTKLNEMIELVKTANREFAENGTDSMAFHDYFQAIIRDEMCIQVFTNRVTDVLEQFEG